jgi:outer membrane protein assembly factor BamA
MRALLCLLLSCGTALAQGGLREVTDREADEHKVAKIVFAHRGERLIKNETLRSAMRTSEGARFERRFFKSDLGQLVNLYRGRGYRDAEIARRRLYLDDEDRLHIHIEIDAGALWRVRTVEIEGGAPFADAELRARLGLGPGDPLDYGKALAGERRLQTFLNRRGYPHATVRNDWVGDDRKSHSVAVVYRVRPGRKMYFGAVEVENGDALHTRRSLIARYLSFRQGDLYDPDQLAHSRDQLARTDLFRSVFMVTPETGDSLQPVVVRLQEKRYIELGANAFINNTEPRVAGTVQHNNWLGRGAQLGLNASWGQPVQGATAFWTERNLLRSGADLVLSVGVTDEWSRTEVLGDPEDPRQFELLTTNDLVLDGLLLFAGEAAAREYINTAVYDYRSIERLWELAAALSKSWREIYQAQFTLTWKRARNRPDASEPILYAPNVDEGIDAGEEPVDDLFGDDDFFDDGDDDFFGDGDDDFFDDGDDDFFGDGGDDFSAGGADAITAVDYSDGEIPVDAAWEEILTERSRSIDLSTEFLRDTRDNRFAPTRGSLLRLTGLYAIKLGRGQTYVVDGEAELRRYQPLTRRLVLALAVQGTRTASLRSGRALPQVYWKEYGGEGSVRGVGRNEIQAVGGGRIGLNARAELRYQRGTFGLVGFWDRGQVWHQVSEVKLSRMVDGYGAGLRYSLGFPFRFDVAFNDGFDAETDIRFYFSIGQAF